MVGSSPAAWSGWSFVLFAVTFIVFLIFILIPGGDPAQRIAGKNATRRTSRRSTADLGLQRPASTSSTWKMMKKIFTGDAGLLQEPAQRGSSRSSRGSRSPSRLRSALRSSGCSSGSSSASSRRQGGEVLRPVLTMLALIGISMPVFWLGSIVLLLPDREDPDLPGRRVRQLTTNPVQWAYHLILPWIMLAVLFIGFYGRVLRSNMLDMMNEDYVRTARAKGLSERQVRMRHVLRNSLIPIVTLFGLDFAAVIGGGAILTETSSSLHGVG